MEYNATQNPDGFGIGWRDGETIRYAKFGPKARSEFEDLLKQLDRNTKIEYVAHWRRATHGAPCAELSHPFPIKTPEGIDLLAFHNGVIKIKTEDGTSDTSTFTDLVLARLEGNWWNNPAQKFLIEQYITNSRFLVMAPDRVTMYHEADWYSIGGLWYSTWPIAWSLKPGFNDGNGKFMAKMPKPAPPVPVEAKTGEGTVTVYDGMTGARTVMPWGEYNGRHQMSGMTGQVKTTPPATTPTFRKVSPDEWGAEPTNMQSWWSTFKDGTDGKGTYNPAASASNGEDTASCDIDDSDSGFSDETRPINVDDENWKAGETIWLHMGHAVTPVSDYSENDDFGQLECQDCGETGEFYMFSGKVYPDIPHKFDKEYVN